MALLVFLCSPRYCVDTAYKSLSVGEAAPTTQQPGQLDEAAMTTGFRSNLSPTELTSGEKGHTPVSVDTGIVNLKLQSQERREQRAVAACTGCHLAEGPQPCHRWPSLESACGDTLSVPQFGQNYGHTERKEAERPAVGGWVSAGFLMGVSICKNTWD